MSPFKLGQLKSAKCHDGVGLYSGRPSTYESSNPSAIPAFAETDGCFFLAVALIMWGPDPFKLFSSAKRNLIGQRHLLETKVVCNSLSVGKRNVPSKIGPMEREALRGGLMNHIYSTRLLYKYDYYNKQILQPVTSSTTNLIKRRSH